MQESMSLEYEPASEPLYIYVKYLYIENCVHRSRVSGELLKRYRGLLLASQDQSWALIVSCVPYLLDSGTAKYNNDSQRLIYLLSKMQVVFSCPSILDDV